MTENTNELPMAIIGETWAQYQAWALASREEKRKQNAARRWTLLLGVLGAILATAAGVLQEGAPAQWLSGLGALAIAAAGFLGKELLTPDRETVWSRCRMVAEALKRQVWLALMRAPPYGGADAGTKLARTTQELAKFEQVTQKMQESGGSGRGLPEASTIDHYIQQRIRPLIQWYRDKAEEHRNALAKWRALSLALGLVAIAFSTLGTVIHSLPAWVSVITSMSAAVLAFVQNGRLQTLPPLYQQTAARLAMELAVWEDEAHKTKAPVDFVLACEEIMARENDSWRMEQFSKQSVANDQGASEDVQTSAAGSTGPEGGQPQDSTK